MKYLILFIKYLKEIKIIKQTWQFEAAVVFVILISTALISNKGLIEFIGVFAVYITFLYITVADRLAESQYNKKQQNEKIEVECYPKLEKYFYLKEVLWFIYFAFLGAWSAIVGVIVFLVYPIWRKSWRKYNEKLN